MITKWITFIKGIFSIIASASLGAIVVFLFISFVARAFEASLPVGADDILQVLMMIFIAGSIIEVASKEGNVRFRAVADEKNSGSLFIQLLELAFVLFVSYALFSISNCGDHCGYVTSNLSISYVPFLLLLSLSFFAYACIVIKRILNRSQC